MGSKEFKKEFLKLNESDKTSFSRIILLNKISPIFLRYLKKNNLKELLPKKDLQNFSLQHQRFQIHTLEAIKEIVSLHHLFKSNGLNPVFLKGPALIKEYDEISLRPFVDIDILFDKSEILKAYNLLENRSYSQIDKKFPINVNKNLEELLQKNHHLPPLCRNTKIMIELHHRITLQKDFEICPLAKSFISGKEKMQFYGNEIEIPNLTDLIVHQLIHFSINTRFKFLLRTFADIAQIEKNHTICWDKVFSRYDDKKIKKGLSLGLGVLNLQSLLTNRYQTIKKKHKAYFPDEAVIRFAHKKTFSDKSPKMKESTKYSLANSSNIIDFMRITLSRVMLPKKEIVRAYNILEPNIFNLVYFYLLNFCLKTVKHGKTVLNLFLKRKSSVENLASIEAVENWLNG